MTKEERIRQCEQEILANAKRYARLTLYGVAINSDGTVIRYGPGEAEEQAEYCLHRFPILAQELLMALSLDDPAPDVEDSYQE